MIARYLGPVERPALTDIIAVLGGTVEIVLTATGLSLVAETAPCSNCSNLLDIRDVDEQIIAIIAMYHRVLNSSEPWNGIWRFDAQSAAGASVRISRRAGCKFAAFNSKISQRCSALAL
jgi:hypothetical protein